MILHTTLYLLRFTTAILTLGGPESTVMEFGVMCADPAPVAHKSLAGRLPCLSLFRRSEFNEGVTASGKWYLSRLTGKERVTCL
jgi:hypothetical protein